jgi:hypothetical protein
MRFRKIKEVAFLGNNERNLALRCLYAQKFFAVLQSGQTIINIDQSWLNKTEFRRYKWGAMGESNSLPVK